MEVMAAFVGAAGAVQRVRRAEVCGVGAGIGTSGWRGQALRTAWTVGSAQAARGAAGVRMEAGNGLFTPSKKKKVIVLGGDGFCGWPTALYLSEIGHDVIVVDNLSRRAIDLELECDSLTPIVPMGERLKAWKEATGKEIPFVFMDVAKQYELLKELIVREKPDAVVHFAEQRAAPYSMKGPYQKKYTVDNNVSGTHNLLCAIVESGMDVHVVHLGTMGVYGYGNSGGEIPEGYIDVTLPGGRERKILHPMYPGSIYHMTKCLDQLLFQFYQRNDELRITDLHQGIVWGTNTPWTVRDERLINRFDYDSDYGTVLNRFLMQAALGYPLTVYGTGGQTRAFIHIQDTCKCIGLAIEHPPKSGAPVEIFNQVAETHRVRDLANMIADLTGCEVKNINNPRKEAAENELEVSNKKFRSLGYEPLSLEAGLLDEVKTIAERYSDRCQLSKIMPSSFWNKSIAKECTSNTDRGNGAADDIDEGLLNAIAQGDKAKIEKLKEVLRG